MSPAIYHHAQKSKYRITLEIEALGDFDPHNINWDKLFQLEGSEHCESYVEDLSTPDRWWSLRQKSKRTMSDLEGIKVTHL